MKMGTTQENLRELLDRHRRPAAWLCEVLGLSRTTIYTHVLAKGRMSDGEIVELAQALDVSFEIVRDALNETRVRPGQDARGRKTGWRKDTTDTSLGGEKKNGASIQVGLGSSGHGALAAHV